MSDINWKRMYLSLLERVTGDPDLVFELGVNRANQEACKRIAELEMAETENENLEAARVKVICAEIAGQVEKEKGTVTDDPFYPVDAAGNLADPWFQS